MAILRVKDENGNTIDIPAIVGPQGPQGPQGPEGPQGPAGPAGEGGTGGGLPSEYVYADNSAWVSHGWLDIGLVSSNYWSLDLSSYVQAGLIPKFIHLKGFRTNAHVGGGAPISVSNELGTVYVWLSPYNVGGGGNCLESLSGGSADLQNITDTVTGGIVDIQGVASSNGELYLIAQCGNSVYDPQNTSVKIYI